MATAQPDSKPITLFSGAELRIGKLKKSIRFSCMIEGNRFTETIDFPIEEALTQKNQATRELRAEYVRWHDKCREAIKAKRKAGDRKIPTIKELIETYREIAEARHDNPAYGKPSLRAITTACNYYGYCVEASGLHDDEPYTKLMDPDMIRKIFRTLSTRITRRGTVIDPVSVNTYVESLQSVTAKWTLLEYRDCGYLVEQPLMPDFGKAKDSRSYRELPRELIEKIWNWYLNLEKTGTPEMQFYATMMLELAMRPSDIALVTPNWFPVVNGQRRLRYVPHKTAESSNRRVDAPILETLYERLVALMPDAFLPGNEDEPILRSMVQTRNKVNKSMREACGMDETEFGKAGYEMRKLCIHAILNTPEEDGGGIEQAVRISGDRRDTIEKYYCDPYKSHTMLPASPVSKLLERI